MHIYVFYEIWVKRSKVCAWVPGAGRVVSRDPSAVTDNAG